MCFRTLGGMYVCALHKHSETLFTVLLTTKNYSERHSNILSLLRWWFTLWKIKLQQPVNIYMTRYLVLQKTSHCTHFLILLFILCFMRIFFSFQNSFKLPVVNWKCKWFKNVHQIMLVCYQYYCIQYHKNIPEEVK